MQPGRPLLDPAAGAAIDSVRQRIGLDPGHPHPPAPPAAQPLTDEDRRAADDLIKQGKTCRLCAGLHPGGELACRRLAAFELDADGQLRAGSFWRDGEWDTSGVLFAAEVQDDEPEPAGE